MTGTVGVCLCIQHRSNYFNGKQKNSRGQGDNCHPPSPIPQPHTHTLTHSLPPAPQHMCLEPVLRPLSLWNCDLCWVCLGYKLANTLELFSRRTLLQALHCSLMLLQSGVVLCNLKCKSQFHSSSFFLFYPCTPSFVETKLKNDLIKT